MDFTMPDGYELVSPEELRQLGSEEALHGLFFISAYAVGVYRNIPLELPSGIAPGPYLTYLDPPSPTYGVRWGILRLVATPQLDELDAQTDDWGMPLKGD